MFDKQKRVPPQREILTEENSRETFTSMTGWQRRRTVEICGCGNVRAYWHNLSSCPHLAPKCKPTEELQSSRIAEALRSRFSLDSIYTRLILAK